MEKACVGLDDVSADEIIEQINKEIYDGASTKEIEKLAILVSRGKIEEEPNYSYVTARIFLKFIYKECFGRSIKDSELNSVYLDKFEENIRLLVENQRLSPDLLSFDFSKLKAALNPSRDSLFKYIGIQTLYDRYLIHLNERRLEAPQAFLMRVAMGLAMKEKDKEEWAIRFYDKMSTFKYMPSTPTLFNAGTLHPQLSSCYLSTLEDSNDGIMGTIHGQANLSKFAGGLALDVTPIRGSGSYIKGTNGNSTGVIPWLKQYNSMLACVNQGGKRKGAGCAYLQTWHIDIEDFLDLRKNTGDERRRCFDMHSANWIPDAFMEAVRDDKDWHLFDPKECRDLQELYGEAFTKRYEEYVKMAKAGKIKIHKVLKAKDLWKKMLGALSETGHPWICFKDASNIRYSNAHCGTVHSSNLCTEIHLHTIASEWNGRQKIVKLGETAVCNLASANLAEHVKGEEIDWETLADTIWVGMRGLDNVIDNNFYPTDEAENANLKHRPVGLGRMGWHDLLNLLKIPFDSAKSAELSDKLSEFISLHAISSSSKLAEERGKYSTYEGSTWSKGIFPIDTYRELTKYRKSVKLHEWQSTEERLPEWKEVRERVAKHGMRNSNTMAIAPTATISYICGCSQSVEPNYSNLFVYSTLSGNFVQINEHFVRELKGLGLWTKKIVKQIKAADGDIKDIQEIPKDLRSRYKVAHDINYARLIDSTAAKQKWVDQGISQNLYNSKNSLKHLSDMYMYAWQMGLKTTYYLHSKAASKIEKTSIVAEEGELRSCPIDGSCESCQ